MSRLRSWATPLTFATFLTVAVTGVVLVFHAGGPLSRLAHEWIGFAVLGAAMLHAAVNWRPLKLYIKRPLAGFIMVIGVVVTLVSSVNLSAAPGRAALTPGAVFGALERAPVSALAEVAGKTPDQLAAGLAAQGFDVTDMQQSAADIAGGDAAATRAILAEAFTPAR